MFLQKVDDAIVCLCDQIVDQREKVFSACTKIDLQNDSGYVAAELAKSLADLLTARKLYGAEREPSPQESQDMRDNMENIHENRKFIPQGNPYHGVCKKKERETKRDIGTFPAE